MSRIISYVEPASSLSYTWYLVIAVAALLAGLAWGFVGVRRCKRRVHETECETCGLRVLVDRIKLETTRYKPNISQMVEYRKCHRIHGKYNDVKLEICPFRRQVGD